jgi:hypothetical protein
MELLRIQTCILREKKSNRVDMELFLLRDASKDSKRVDAEFLHLLFNLDRKHEILRLFLGDFLGLTWRLLRCLQLVNIRL